MEQSVVISDLADKRLFWRHDDAITAWGISSMVSFQQRDIFSGKIILREIFKQVILKRLAYSSLYRQLRDTGDLAPVKNYVDAAAHLKVGLSLRFCLDFPLCFRPGNLLFLCCIKEVPVFNPGSMTSFFDLPPFFRCLFVSDPAGIGIVIDQGGGP